MVLRDGNSCCGRPTIPRGREKITQDSTGNEDAFVTLVLLHLKRQNPSTTSFRSSQWLSDAYGQFCCGWLHSLAFSFTIACRVCHNTHWHLYQRGLEWRCQEFLLGQAGMGIDLCGEGSLVGNEICCETGGDGCTIDIQVEWFVLCCLPQWQSRLVRHEPCMILHRI